MSLLNMINAPEACSGSVSSWQHTAQRLRSGSNATTRNRPHRHHPWKRRRLESKPLVRKDLRRQRLRGQESLDGHLARERTL